MPSGKRLVINTRERAISDDINKLQQLARFSAMERLRRSVNLRTAGGEQFPGLQISPDAPGNFSDPVSHDVLSGLMVRPDNAGYLLVDPGAVAMIAPGYSALTGDDSPLVAAASEGVQNTNELTFTPNAGPGIRWDVVECRVTDSLAAQASRDIYDPATGLFSAVIVDKEFETLLEFRIALGAPGGGLRSPDPDWVPLAVIMTPASAVGFLQCDVFDVRPLVYERAQHPQPHPLFNFGLANSQGIDAWAREVVSSISIASGDFWSGGLIMQGFWRGEFAGFRSGGQLSKNVGTAGTAGFGLSGAGQGEDSSFAPNDTQNHSAAITLTGLVTYAIAAMFPRGYPRWVRYSQSPLVANTGNPRAALSGRLPRGGRGILIVANAVFANRNGLGQTSMPPQMGLSGSEWGQVVGFAARAGDGSMITARGRGREFYFGSAQLNNTFPAVTHRADVSAPFAVNNVGATWRLSVIMGTLAKNANAKAWLVEVQVVMTVPTGDATITVIAFVADGTASNNASYLPIGQEILTKRDAVTSEIIRFKVWVPAGESAPAFGAGGPNSSLVVFIDGTISAIPTANAFLRGYRL